MPNDNSGREKDIYMFVVDGKVMGAMIDGAAFKREQKRLMNLGGVEIKLATENVIKRYFPHLVKKADG